MSFEQLQRDVRRPLIGDLFGGRCAKSRLFIPMCALFAITACMPVACSGKRTTPRRVDDTHSVTQTDVKPSEARAVEALLAQFGAHLKDVSLLAPDSLRVKQMVQAYGEFVTPKLLETWKLRASTAPGREVSSPWPDRIEPLHFQKLASGKIEVDAEVVYVTSAERVKGGATARERVTFVLGKAENGRWLISGYKAGRTGPGSP